MKTSYLLTMAMTALLTAGCSQNEITEMSPDVRPAVGFSVYATPQTRGTVTDNGTANTGIKNASVGFGVLAYYTQTVDFASTHTPNFMYNQQVTWNTSPTPGAWEYTPVKYWPNTEGDKISFFAYAPYEDAPAAGTNKGIVLSKVTDTNHPTITFTLKDKASEMIDLVATNATQNTAASQTMNLLKTTGKVPFKFEHVLTKLNFCAKLASDLASLTNTETKVFVKSVKLLGTSADSPAAANSSSVFWKTATYKFADGQWDYTTTGSPAKALKQAAAVTLDGGLFAGVNQTFGPAGSQYTTSSVAITSLNTAVNLFNNNQALYLIPPTNTGITDENTVRVLITYDVVTLDDKLNDKKSVVETKAVASLPVGTMKPGVAYKYTFTIGLESVKVDTSVDSWNTETNAAIPGVDATAGSAVAIGAAITTLNTTKANNPNCNYFTVNIPYAAASSSLALSGTTSNFKSGDKIELNFTTASTVSSVTLSGWTSAGTLSSRTGTIILTKN